MSSQILRMIWLLILFFIKRRSRSTGQWYSYFLYDELGYDQCLRMTMSDGFISNEKHGKTGRLCFIYMAVYLYRLFANLYDNKEDPSNHTPATVSYHIPFRVRYRDTPPLWKIRNMIYGTPLQDQAHPVPYNSVPRKQTVVLIIYYYCVT